MKKQLIFLCTLAVVANACKVEESGLNSDFSTTTITASFESFLYSKASYDDYGNFSWTENDVILVYTSEERFYHMDKVKEIDENSAIFSGTISGEATGLGVYPYLGTLPEYDNDNDKEALKVYLPESYDWIEGVAYNPMVSFTTNFVFKNLGALFKVTLNNIPSSATKVTFYTGKKISGWFDVDLELEDPVIYAGDDTDEGVGVTFNFDELQEPTEMVFYVPVPTGTYPCIGFKVKDENDEILWPFEGSSKQEMPRNHLMILPTLSP